jgi:hypothetical protein
VRNEARVSAVASMVVEHEFRSAPQVVKVHELDDGQSVKPRHELILLRLVETGHELDTVQRLFLERG